MKTSTKEKLPPSDRILNAACRLFYQEGIQAVGIDRITREAEVALNTLYHHYPSKDHLVKEYLTRRDSSWLDWFGSYVQPGASLETNTGNLFRGLSDWFHEDSFRGCAFINVAGEVGDAKPEVFAITKEHKKSVYNIVFNLCAQAGVASPDKLATKIMLLVEGAIVMAYMNNDPDVADDAKEAALCLVKACQ